MWEGMGGFRGSGGLGANLGDVGLQFRGLGVEGLRFRVWRARSTDSPGNHTRFPGSG